VNRILGVVTAVLLAVTVAACSDSSGPDTPPGLDRIDGPAQVDPSFDPFATVPPTTPAPPSVTDDGG
jgi:hypothetical protein